MAKKSSDKNNVVLTEQGEQRVLALKHRKPRKSDAEKPVSFERSIIKEIIKQIHSDQYEDDDYRSPRPCVDDPNI